MYQYRLRSEINASVKNILNRAIFGLIENKIKLFTFCTVIFGSVLKHRKFKIQKEVKNIESENVEKKKHRNRKYRKSEMQKTKIQKKNNIEFMIFAKMNNKFSLKKDKMRLVSFK